MPGEIWLENLMNNKQPSKRIKFLLPSLVKKIRQKGRFTPLCKSQQNALECKSKIALATKTPVNFWLHFLPFKIIASQP